MEIKEFMQELGLELSKKTDLEFEFKEITKNNNVKLNAVIIGEGNIKPTIYVDDMFRAVESGKRTLEQVVSDLLDTYEENKKPCINVNTEQFSKEYILEGVVMDVVNAEMNKDKLQEIPHIPYLDLAIVFYKEIDDTERFLITNDIMERYQLSIDEIKQVAKYPALSIKTMGETLAELTGQAFVLTDNRDILVVSSESKVHGAVHIFNDEMLEELAQEFKDGFYVIPCSIHEILILTQQLGPSANEIIDMIHQVNETELRADEVLSNSLYTYDANEKTLKIA